ncbi:inositol-1,4-bisphosphate 1-phosphatase [Aureococcus anophagefferens]|nr:inositol-1,4-bisphosphate 1-phosphatase [Aureococcus anophagefferens]
MAACANALSRTVALRELVSTCVDACGRGCARIRDVQQSGDLGAQLKIAGDARSALTAADVAAQAAIVGSLRRAARAPPGAEDDGAVGDGDAELATPLRTDLCGALPDERADLDDVIVYVDRSTARASSSRPARQALSLLPGPVAGGDHAADVARDVAGAPSRPRTSSAVPGRRRVVPPGRGTRASNGCRLRLTWADGGEGSVFYKRVVMAELPAAVKKQTTQPAKLLRDVEPPRWPPRRAHPPADAPGRTLIHGDLKARTSSWSAARSLIDFQFVGWGLAATDLAHFVCCAVDGGDLLDGGDAALVGAYKAALREALVGAGRAADDAAKILEGFDEQFDAGVVDIARLVFAYQWPRIDASPANLRAHAHVAARNSDNKNVDNAVWLVARADAALRRFAAPVKERTWPKWQDDLPSGGL